MTFLPPGKGPAWAQGFLSSDYELLCRDGTRAPVTDWKRCNLVRVPSRGVVVHSDVSSSEVYEMLNAGLVRIRRDVRTVGL